MKVSLQLWQETLNPAAGRQEDMSVAYSEEGLYGAGMEAGIASQKIETVFMQESFRLEKEASAKDIELIAQGMFDKGGFFNNIWKAIADAFKRVADFIGQLFGKITGATEKNLKTVKDQMVLLQNNSKYKGLTEDNGKIKLKEGSYIKVPKTSVLGPLLTAIVEINNVAADDATGSLDALKYGNTTLFDFYDVALQTYADTLSEKKEVKEQDTKTIRTYIDAVRTSSNSGNDPINNGDKAVKVQLAKFLKTIADNISERSVGSPEIKAKIEFINNNKISQEGGTLASVFRIPGDVKNMSKPEDKDDIKKFVLDTYKAVSEDKRVENGEIVDFLKVIRRLAEATILDDASYINTEKFFKDGKDKFMKLSEKYEDIAKEFESAVNSASSDTTTENKAQTAANSVKSMVGQTGEITKLTSFFTQLSLKWYSTIDGLLSLGLANFLNLIKVALSALESNTVEVVV